MSKQDSVELELRELEARQEETRLAFASLLKYVFDQTKSIWQYADVYHIDSGAVSRATAQDKSKFRKPEYATLYRWCHALYVHRGRRLEERKIFRQIMTLAGYAMPADVNMARRTTEQRIEAIPKAAKSQEKETDKLGDIRDPEYLRRIEALRRLQNA